MMTSSHLLIALVLRHLRIIQINIFANRKYQITAVKTDTRKLIHNLVKMSITVQQFIKKHRAHK